MPSINSTEDLLNLLESNAEFRNAVRRWVLGDELLSMPALMRRMDERLASVESTQQQMAALLKQVVARLDTLEARQDQHETRLAAIEATQRQMAALLKQVIDKQNQADQRMDKMDGRMDNIETTLRDVKRHSDSMWGEWVERKAADKLVPFVGHTYRANRVYPFWGEHGAATDFRRDAFEDAISDAEDNGSIHPDEALRLRETDLVIRARRKSDGAILWFVVEASGTLDDDDIERVERSAVALRKVYPHDEVAPMIFGYRIANRYKQAADDGNIQVVLTDG